MVRTVDGHFLTELFILDKNIIRLLCKVVNQQLKVSCLVVLVEPLHQAVNIIREIHGRWAGSYDVLSFLLQKCFQFGLIFEIGPGFQQLVLNALNAHHGNQGCASDLHCFDGLPSLLCVPNFKRHILLRQFKLINHHDAVLFTLYRIQLALLRRGLHHEILGSAISIFFLT